MGRVNMQRCILVVTVALAASLAARAEDKKWYPFPVEEHNPPFDMNSPVTKVMYEPLQKAEKKWNICVSFPHMKDAYWLAVDYGVAEEAKDLGVTMHLVEAGGYTNLAKQISQIEDCVSAGAQAVVIGAISYDGLKKTVKALNRRRSPSIESSMASRRQRFPPSPSCRLRQWATRRANISPSSILKVLAR